MELFEQIRLEYEFGVGTIQGVARKLRVHRRVVREAIQSAVPARRKKTERLRRSSLTRSLKRIARSIASNATQQRGSGTAFATKCQDARPPNAR